MHFTPATIPSEAAAQIAPAFDRFGLHDAEEWVARCREGTAHLWRCGDSWATTEVIDLPKLRICHITALAGVWDQEIMQEIEAWAKSHGCQRVFFTGRKGWAKKLPDYSPIATVFEKVIT